MPIATARLSIFGALRKILRLLRIGQELLDVLLVFLGIEPDDVFLDPAEHAQLGLDDHARRMRDFHGFCGDVNVLFIWMMRAVDHHAGVPVVRCRS